MVVCETLIGKGVYNMWELNWLFAPDWRKRSVEVYTCVQFSDARNTTEEYQLVGTLLYFLRSIPIGGKSCLKDIVYILWWSIQISGLPFFQAQYIHAVAQWKQGYKLWKLLYFMAQ